MRAIHVFLVGFLSLLTHVHAQITVPPGRGGAVVRPRLQKPRAGVVTVTLKKSPVKVTFVLSSDARTSVGVFTKTGSLVRTIWSAKQTLAGNVVVRWDGKDDFGNAVAAGDYEFKLLSSNVAYKWMGVLGNSSTDIDNQSTMQRGFTRIKAMHAEGSKIYYGDGYAEGHPSQAYADTSAIQKRREFFPDGKTGQATKLVVSDGVNVYWAGYDFFSDPKKNLNFIHATKVSDNTSLSFANGVQVKTANGADYGYTYTSCIVGDTTGLANNTDLYTGLAVQRSGSYLFVSEGVKNRIRVYNKTTAALVQTITLTSPGALAVDVTSDNAIWVVSNKVVTKRPINADGTLGAATLTLPNLGKPMAMDVSPDGQTVAVCDGDTSQRVKGYSTSTGAIKWLMGVKGGYYNDPTVSTGKFYFDDVSGGINDTYITYAANGTFWVGDDGNYRSLHFSAARTYLGQIAYLENCYTTAVDQNNPTRLFAQYLEFSVSDYDNPATAWTLVKNYRATVPSAYIENSYNRMQGIFMVDVMKYAVTVLGHTYALIKKMTDNTLSVVELLPNAPLRFTGQSLTNAPWVINADGSLGIQQISWVGQTGSGTCSWKRQPLNSIDASGNPVWVAQQTILTTSIGQNDPIDFSGYGVPFSLTSTGKLICFAPYKHDAVTGVGLSYHLAGYQSGGRVWGSHMATSPTYVGPYPTDGAYDIGNGVNYGGGNAPVVDNHVFATYHGENWKNGQVNKFTHWFENGLLVGNFGVTQAEAAADPITYRGMAGNVFGATAVLASNGNAYLVHGEEFGWSGLHIWRASNLSSIQVQTVMATLATDEDPRGKALFAGLPKFAGVANGSAGVVRSPAADAGSYAVKTNLFTYSRTDQPSVTFTAGQTAGDYYVRLPVTKQTGLTSWVLQYTMISPELSNKGELGDADSGGLYVDLLDAQGNILVRYSQKISGSNTLIRVNGVTITTVTGQFGPGTVPIVISNSGSSISVKYGNLNPVVVAKYDASATIGSPATIQLFGWLATGQNNYRAVTVADAFFKTN